MLRTLTLMTSTAALMASAVWATELPAPTEDVILTVSGNVETRNVGDTAQLDEAMFEALEQATIKTSTIWTEGTQTFQGVSLTTLVDVLGITGGTLRASAINDYTIEIPLTDAVEGGPIVAHRINGETISVRDKGPLWIVYPYDDDSKYRTEVIYSRSIWQLDRLEAVD